MATISRDTPCLSITSVARGRLPVFRTDAIKKITCAALDEARRSGGFAMFAYLIMFLEDEPLLMDLKQIIWRKPR